MPDWGKITRALNKVVFESIPPGAFAAKTPKSVRREVVRQVMSKTGKADLRRLIRMRDFPK